ncbi:MAG TPA: hypothetical protein VFR37_21470 [Longimicrobium sp.]|nr:hypothetical protein [Longimicrobium sp.]
MSHGDSLDGFVFPPFVPPAAARPVDPPTPASQSSVPEPTPSADTQTAARPTLPWDVETPMVGEVADLPPLAAAPAEADEAEDEDLPWLERPVPRDTEEAPAAAAQEPAAAQANDGFPDWMAWDDRDADEARSDAEGLPAVEGLEDFVPVDDLGSHFSPAPAVDWTEAEPVADAAAGIDAADAPVTEDPADSSAWSLDAAEGDEPPLLFESGDASALALDEPAALAEPGPSAAEETEPEPLEWEPAAALAQAVPANGEHGPASTGGPFEEVAARLEDIARTLRERPDALLGGDASDPLALLVAGYVMGYRARGGR